MSKRCEKVYNFPSFLDQNDRYKLVAMQLSHEAVLTMIPIAGRKFLPRQESKHRNIL